MKGQGQEALHPGAYLPTEAYFAVITGQSVSYTSPLRYDC